MAGKNIERQIENRMVTLLSTTGTYFATNSVPVRAWREIATELTGYQVIVHCLPVQPVVSDANGTATAWKCKLDLIALLHNTQTDVIATSTIYEELHSYLLALTVATLQTTLTGITIDGIVNVDHAEEMDERLNSQTVSAEIYLH